MTAEDLERQPCQNIIHLVAFNYLATVLIFYDKHALKTYSFLLSKNSSVFLLNLNC